MNVRESLQKHTKVISAVAITAILAGTTLAVMQWQADFAPSYGRFAYFSDDDGKTWFADDVEKAAPFDHKGRMALRAFVVEKDGRQSVAYLGRYKPQAKETVDKMAAAVASGKYMNAPPPGYSTYLQAKNEGFEYKLPGDHPWTSKPPAMEGNATFAIP